MILITKIIIILYIRHLDKYKHVLITVRNILKL